MCLSLMVGLGVCTGESWWELSMCVILTGAAFVLIHVWFGLHVSFTFCGAWSFSSASGACLRFWGAYCLSFLCPVVKNCQCIEFSDLSLASNYFIFTLTFILIYSCFHAHIWSFIPSFILIHSGFGFSILNYGLLPFLPCLPSEVYHCASISAFFAFWILDWMGQISGEYSCLSAFFAFTA